MATWCRESWRKCAENHRRTARRRARSRRGPARDRAVPPHLRHVHVAPSCRAPCLFQFLREFANCCREPGLREFDRVNDLALHASRADPPAGISRHLNHGGRSLSNRGLSPGVGDNSPSCRPVSIDEFSSAGVLIANRVAGKFPEPVDSCFTKQNVDGRAVGEHRAGRQHECAVQPATRSQTGRSQ